MENLIKIFDKSFCVTSDCSSIGSCTDDFLLNRAINLIEKSDLEKSDKYNLIALFKDKAFHSLRGFDNGRGAGRRYINLIKNYFKQKESIKNMKKYNIELDATEIVKLISACNSAIIIEERNLKFLGSEKLKDTTNNSIEKLNNIKNKLKQIMLQA